MALPHWRTTNDGNYYHTRALPARGSRHDVPGVYNALSVDADTPIGHISTILEVESELSNGVVRTVAMSSTDGLQRGLSVTDTGHPMMMPVGASTLGRVWNVMGQPVDGKPMPDDAYSCSNQMLAFYLPKNELLFPS